MRKSFIFRAISLTLVLAFLIIALSALVLASHSCEHSHTCSVCSYYSEASKTLLISTILSVFTFLSISILTLAFLYCKCILPRSTPILLKVKLSN